MCGANFVVFCLLTLCMICTIYFYYQHSVKAYEINNIIINDVLPSKVHSQPLLPQELPQIELCWSLLLPVLSGKGSQ